MDIEKLTKILEPIYGNADREKLKRLQLREGEAAATDGRILARVDLPGFSPTPEQAAECFEPAFKVALEKPVFLAADRDWIIKNLNIAVENEWVEIAKRHEAELDAAIAEFNRRSTKCPCCGEDIAIVDDEGFSIRGRLRSFDEWIDEEAPPPLRSPVHVDLRAPGAKEALPVFVRDLYRALVVALALGGAGELRIAKYQLQLIGNGFAVIVISAGWIETNPVRTIDVPALRVEAVE